MTYTDDIFTIGSLSEASVGPGIMSLARDRARRHGPVNITSEASGIHIYIPDPELLVKDGIKELTSKHLAINAEKYLGIGRYNIKSDTSDEQHAENVAVYKKYRSQGKEVPCAVSMKTGKVYAMSYLLKEVTPLEVRKKVLPFNIKASVNIGAVRKNLVYDSMGNLVPDWVGKTTPLSELPETHPAIMYLRERGFEPLLLQYQMNACYCYEAYPEDASKNRFYGKLPGGLRITPQGRIILSIMMDGVRWGYQSRLIDRKVDGKYYVWGDDQKWHLIRYMDDTGKVQEVYPPDDYWTKGFDPPKYLNATGSERNKLLMGYDAAVKTMSKRPFEQRYCVLCEGPLDAAKLRAPAIAILGKSLSDFQADAIAKQFPIVRTVMDKDKAGQQCLANIQAKMNERGIRIKNFEVPGDAKDAGDLSYEEAGEIMKQCDPLRNQS